MHSSYRWMMVAGILVTLVFWTKLARRDSRLMIIYLVALGGAFAGAKIVYLLAEGWLYVDSPRRWLIWATGKTVLGALLGGYPAVELAKKSLSYKGTTGDWFALIAPIGIAAGRIGCWLNGCCLGQACEPAWWTMTDANGIARWPAVPVEIAFNLGMLGLVLCLRWRRILQGQHFHLYLMAYGGFRFVHEIWRDTPRLWLGMTGYQIAAAGVFCLGAYGFRRRAGEWTKRMEGTKPRILC